ncbi:MAG: hypothetical protein HQ519_09125 [Planctomycetes bacterium]|nr:hypothetical protein [Planctomycetota bacterium]
MNPSLKQLFTWSKQSIHRGGWAPLVVFGSHTIGSLGWNAYRKIPNLDIPMHILGGVAIAYFFWHSIHCPIAREVLGQPSKFARQLLTLTATGATTGLWELAEWTTDRMGLTHAQGGVDDTMLDLFLGMFGGLVFLIWKSFK